MIYALLVAIFVMTSMGTDIECGGYIAVCHQQAVDTYRNIVVDSGLLCYLILQAKKILIDTTSMISYAEERESELMMRMSYLMKFFKLLYFLYSLVFERYIC